MTATCEHKSPQDPILTLLANLTDGPGDLPWPQDNVTWGGYGSLTIDMQREKAACIGLTLPDWGLEPAAADAVLALCLPWAGGEVARFDEIGMRMRTLRLPHPVERTDSATLRAVAWSGARAKDSLRRPLALLDEMGAREIARQARAAARARTGHPGRKEHR